MDNIFTQIANVAQTFSKNRMQSLLQSQSQILINQVAQTQGVVTAESLKNPLALQQKMTGLVLNSLKQSPDFDNTLYQTARTYVNTQVGSYIANKQAAFDANPTKSILGVFEKSKNAIIKDVLDLKTSFLEGIGVLKKNIAEIEPQIPSSIHDKVNSSAMEEITRLAMADTPDMMSRVEILSQAKPYISAETYANLKTLLHENTYNLGTGELIEARDKLIQGRALNKKERTYATLRNLEGITDAVKNYSPDQLDDLAGQYDSTLLDVLNKIETNPPQEGNSPQQTASKLALDELVSPEIESRAKVPDGETIEDRIGRAIQTLDDDKQKMALLDAYQKSEFIKDRAAHLRSRLAEHSADAMIELGLSPRETMDFTNIRDTVNKIGRLQESWYQAGRYSNQSTFMDSANLQRYITAISNSTREQQNELLGMASVIQNNYARRAFVEQLAKANPVLGGLAEMKIIFPTLDLASTGILEGALSKTKKLGTSESYELPERYTSFLAKAYKDAPEIGAGIAAVLASIPTFTELGITPSDLIKKGADSRTENYVARAITKDNPIYKEINRHGLFGAFGFGSPTLQDALQTMPIEFLNKELSPKGLYSQNQYISDPSRLEIRNAGGGGYYLYYKGNSLSNTYVTDSTGDPIILTQDQITKMFTKNINRRSTK